MASTSLAQDEIPPGFEPVPPEALRAGEPQPEIPPEYRARIVPGIGVVPGLEMPPDHPYWKAMQGWMQRNTPPDYVPPGFEPVPETELRPINPSPPAFAERLAQGGELSEAFKQELAKPYSQRLKEWTTQQLKEGNYGRVALGTVSAAIAGIPDMAISGVIAGYDALTGKLLTGPGLRKEDFSDDPHAPEPLDALIQRAQDMAMTGGVRSTFGDAPAAPLLRTPDGKLARIVTDADGATRAHIIGDFPPTHADFSNAAVNIASPRSDLTLHSLGEQQVPNPKTRQFATGNRFEITDKAGNRLGIADVVPDGKTLNLTWVGPQEGTAAAPINIGPARVRGLLDQLRSFYPDADEITGVRISGAHQPGAEQVRVPLPPKRDAAVIEQKLRDAWEQEGKHPAELATDAQNDAFLAHDLSSAAANPEDIPPPDVTALSHPTAQPGRLGLAFREAGQKLLDLTGDIQKATVPMAYGDEIIPKAAAKDFMNAKRRNAWVTNSWVDDIDRRFSPQEQNEMWLRLEEQSQWEQAGELPPDGVGLSALKPDARAEVEKIMAHNTADWARMDDLGMVRGEPIPAYAARIAVNVKRGDMQGAVPINSLGLNLKTSTARLKGRRYLTVEETEAALKSRFPEASISRNIKANILAMKQEHDAIAGRELVNAIRDYSGKLGTDAVAEGFKPSDEYFTIDHPALKTWRPRLEQTADGWRSIKDENGDTVMEQVPLYIHRDWEGPLRAVLSQKPNNVIDALMAGKAKAMSVIMYSPFVHNGVIYSKVLAGFKGNVIKTAKLYFDGNRIKNDPAQMIEAIDGGMVPIGKRFFNQDITDQLTAPDIAPGRSLTAKITGAVPGLFDEAAGTAVKRAIDSAGEFYHNTLLWDRVADLQAGIFAHFRDEFLSSGMDRQTAARMAAHEANRLAGALPVESMSQASRAIGNVLLFSRSFTLGNFAIMKDALGDLPAGAWNRVADLFGSDLKMKGFGGLPPDVLAQIERDKGLQVAQDAKAIARRQAISTVITDMALFYVGTSLMQSAANVILGGAGLSDEAANYWTRLQKALEAKFTNPWSSVPPWGIYSFLQDLSAAGGNEPHARDRVLIGYGADGTALYAKSPLGRIGEEFSDYSQGFWRDLLLRKLGTTVRPAWEIIANDKGFGRKVYDPHIESASDALAAAWQMAKLFVESQVPARQIEAAWDLAKGEGDQKLNTLATVGPFLPPPFTFTVSKGAPGGPAVGELYDAREQHDFRLQQALPGIRQMIQRGDVAGASAEMSRLGVPAGLQRFYIRTTMNPATRLSPRTLRDFYLYATPAQRQRFEALRAH